MKQAGEEVPTPREAEAHESSEAKAPTIAEATEGEAESSSGAVEPSAQDVETGAAQALVWPLVQDPPPSQESAQEVEVQAISSDDTSWGKDVADAEAASTTEQPAPTSGEGSSALVQV